MSTESVIGNSYPTTSERSMIKTIIIHHLLDMNDLPAAERWFYRYHIPEVLRNQPVSYVSYRAVPPPPGAEDFGYCNYKVHENLNRGEGEKPLGLLTMTKEVVPLKVIMVNVPAAPTEDFMGRGRRPSRRRPSCAGSSPFATPRA